ncbi:membrane-bound lytic murein transglycosylase D [Arcticibacter tournemirensis]|nr:LysM peptidoglycan-binding domain-containing protein [Arcticibacter tournemirensis]TQM47020.1 membrane-bound lytic murein transglycosylase D [Arcticibacter tournemirensis]
MMRKTTASALFLLAGMITISFSSTSMAATGSKQLSQTTGNNTDSLNYKQSLQIIQNKIPLTYNEYVQRFIDSYTTSQKARFSKMLGLSKYYFPIYEKVFKERNVPEELKYISVIESSLNPDAVSRVGATGPWQFMYGTGKIYGLTIDDWVDERKDPVKACNAAASYFLDSYFLYDDWLLAIASYNCGRNNIKWAIAKAGGKKDFWAIREYLPVETRNYVPAFIATAYVMTNYWKHNINPSEPDFNINTDVITVNAAVSLKDIARAANISEEELSILNPSLKKPIINGSVKDPKNLIIPVTKQLSYNTLYEVLNGAWDGKASVMNASYSAEGSRGGQISHKVKPGETILDVANQYGTEVQDIKVWNNLKTSAVVPGQVIKILSPKITPSVVKKESTTGNGYITYEVKQGDTLSSIAQKFDGATEEEIRVINQLKHASAVKPGMILKIMGG